MEAYKDNGAIDCDIRVDTSTVKGKTAVITGGANGIGEAYVRALVKAGAFVVIGDVEEAAGSKLANELGESTVFVRCDVTRWSDQLEMFKKAIEFSPSHRIDIVVANAGISGGDSVFFHNTDLEEPEEPKLNILDINGLGVMYTIKLAMHYFRRQHAHGASEQDTVLVLQGSLAGYLDLPGTIQYTFAKYGLRGVMKTLRRTEWQYGTRVNYIAPWFVKTRILSDASVKHLEARGTTFATVEDAAEGLMRIVSDKSVNGRSLAIVPREMIPQGYLDLDIDDYRGNGFLAKIQAALGAGNSGQSHRASLSKDQQAY